MFINRLDQSAEKKVGGGNRCNNVIIGTHMFEHQVAVVARTIFSRRNAVVAECGNSGVRAVRSLRKLIRIFVVPSPVSEGLIEMDVGQNDIRIIRTRDGSDRIAVSFGSRLGVRRSASKQSDRTLVRMVGNTVELTTVTRTRGRSCGRNGHRSSSAVVVGPVKRRRDDRGGCAAFQTRSRTSGRA